VKTLFRWIIRLATLAVVFLVALALILWLLKTQSDQRFYAAYHSEAPLKVRTRPHHTKGETKQLGAVFDGVDGIPVPLVSFYPAGKTTAPFPCVIFLHGIGQNKTFLELIAPHFTARGYAIVCFDQYTRGERRLAPETGKIKKGLAIRRRAALTVMETRRLVDYLQTDSEIAAERIYLVGASFGAMMATIAAAQEPRIAGTALIYGGGDWKCFGDSTLLQQELGPWSTSAAAGAAFLLAPADPVHYAGKLASRPLLIQNGSRDTIVPASAAQALIDAAGKQAQVIWYDSDHVGLDEKHVEVVLNDILAWLDQIDRH
jgi:dienelactone hydrolase